LWRMIDQWVAGLADEIFMQVLPLLRRTFAHFSHPERRKLGEKAKSGGGQGAQHATVNTEFDVERAKQGLPVMMKLLGLTALNVQK
jgi:hypothetical protein